MGDMFTPGLSGGERKRASIACELLRDPELIFLDVSTGQSLNNAIFGVHRIRLPYK